MAGYMDWDDWRDCHANLHSDLVHIPYRLEQRGA